MPNTLWQLLAPEEGEAADGASAPKPSVVARAEAKVQAIIEHLVTTKALPPPSQLPPPGPPPPLAAGARGAVRDICSDKIVVLTLSHPTLPTVDLFDLPVCACAEHTCPNVCVCVCMLVCM